MFGILVQPLPYTTAFLPALVGSEPGTSASTPFSFADEIYGYAGRLAWTLYYFLALAGLIILTLIWILLGLPAPGFVYLLIGIYGLILAIGFPFAVWNGIRLIRPLRRWMKDYFRFATVVKFELFPVEGSTPEDRILNKLAEVYPELDRLRMRAPRAIQRETGLRKRPRVVWDIVCDLNYPRYVRIPWIHRYLGVPEYFLIRRFPGPIPVSLEDMRVLIEGLTLDLHPPRPAVRRVLVVSAAGFSPNAIHGVETEAIPGLAKFDVLLVTETPTGYRLPIKE